MSNVDRAGGLWLYISARSPAPERGEIEQIIGRSIIDRNLDLLAELKALKDIVFESSGGRISSDNNWGKSKRTTGRRAISEARQYSQLHYGEESMKESSSQDVLYGMKHFTLEAVTDRLDEIRDCFEAERVEIGQEIDRLNDHLGGDFGMDCETSVEYERGLPKSMSAMSLSSAPVPADRMETCSVCNTKRPAASLSSSGGSKNGLPVCTMCETTRALRDAKIGGATTSLTAPSSSSASSVTSTGSAATSGAMLHSRSIPAHLSAADLKLNTASVVAENTRRNNNEDSPNGAPKSARSAVGRFRSRLDSARHEHHFLDEF